MDAVQKGRTRPAGPSHAGTYYRWARFYDLIFDWPFHPGRLAAARAVAEALPPGGKVLVAGVGTGLELALLPRIARVTGIDLARPMLDIARERVRRKKLDHVEALQVMDAGVLEFGDASFDVVLAPYLLSVAPSPRAVLDEMWRVTRPGGEMIILNHFSAEAGLRARAERRLQNAGAWLGWRPHFPHAVVGDWLSDQRDAGGVREREIAPFRLFTLLRVTKVPQGRRAADHPA
ncbi:class I SAM-dependent methyltransferase [Labrys monachus]|uniref:Phosphatidylethanolamine/phosphatidyl-N-methylethanolamine N-methyltransferase n=1 Tax=Labrys monachus TaxID=217067 RepID=A0ABU0F926_9HYPH|nr:class I SAM-dependent methyltransferase [Labrys monachus]MDQ0391102.1 phosphatidylethanolamine/phosphatidyl-N-methylethanolamine N-methyltransferase [Labrys monachus]